ncbi:MAG: M20/M25/M40 family metallo-hydrolase [Chitinophagaceae bacterium]|nr:M20/M25/M40 family metallo-hydrolase [Chitinophagaceae bacterium]
MSSIHTITESAINLLKKMIATPSLSREEKEVADLIEQYLQENGITTGRLINNVYALNKYFDPAKKSILLNSHHDTVKPAKGYTTDPFTPTEIEGRLIGLGSNDAGGPLVSLIATFIHFFNRETLPFNIILAATAEEEISGTNGVELLLNNEQFLDMLQGSTFMGALVGEPTKMQMAVAERGLLVLDGTVHGRAGHAAREEGINAIYLAMQDIQAIAHMDFEKTSELLGKTTAKVTVIETDNKAHNVVPATCRFVIDVRVNEQYGFDEVLDRLKANLKAELVPRSFRLRSSMIAMDHPIVKAGKQLGLSHYGSPTTSDKALMTFPALKIGPGDSARSHTADEYIYISEIENGIIGYIQLLETTISVY